MLSVFERSPRASSLHNSSLSARRIGWCAQKISLRKTQKSYRAKWRKNPQGQVVAPRDSACDLFNKEKQNGKQSILGFRRGT